MANRAVLENVLDALERALPRGVPSRSAVQGRRAPPSRAEAPCRVGACERRGPTGREEEPRSGRSAARAALRRRGPGENPG